MGGNQKRPAGGAGGAKQGNSKRKKKYTNNGKAGGKVHQSTLHEKSFGVVVTVERYKKAKAQREVTAFLNEALRKIYPNKFCDPSAPESVDAADSNCDPKTDEPEELTLEEELAAEIASARKEWKEDKGTVDGIKSLVTERVLLSNEILFYQFPAGVQPEHFTHSVFAQLKTLDLPTTKFCHRMLPVTKVCKSQVETIKQECVSILQSHFHNANESHKFSVMFKCKYNDAMKKERLAVITAVADVVDGPKFGHTVDLDNPEKIIFVEIIEKWCLMSVVEGYVEHRKYNLMSMTADLLKEDEADSSNKGPSEDPLSAPEGPTAPTHADHSSPSLADSEDKRTQAEDTGECNINTNQ